MQSTASLSDKASYTHGSLSSSSPGTAIVRPRNRAAVASLMVQPMGTWNGRNLQCQQAHRRGCSAHPRAPALGAHLVRTLCSVGRSAREKFRPGWAPAANPYPDTRTLGGPGPLPSWTQFSVLAEAPPPRSRAVLSLCLPPAWAQSRLQHRRAYISLLHSPPSPCPSRVTPVQSVEPPPLTLKQTLGGW